MNTGGGLVAASASRKYGVHTLTLYLIESNAQNAVRLAVDAGYDGVQASPLRPRKNGFADQSRDKVKTLSPYVISFEDAFNYGSFRRVVRRLIGNGWDSDPSILDWLLFASLRLPLYRGAIYCVHGIEDLARVQKTASYLRVKIPTVLEIHAELSCLPQDYISLQITEGISFAADTWHIVRPRRDTGQAIQNWERLLNDIGSSIKLVHVHPTREEVRDLLNYNTNSGIVQRAMLIAKVVGPQVPVILEMFPPLTIRKTSLVDTLRKIRAVLGQIFDGA